MHMDDRQTLPAREAAVVATEAGLAEGGEGVSIAPLPARPAILAGAAEAVTSPLRYVGKF